MSATYIYAWTELSSDLCNDGTAPCQLLHQAPWQGPNLDIVLLAFHRCNQLISISSHMILSAIWNKFSKVLQNCTSP